MDKTECCRDCEYYIKMNVSIGLATHECTRYPKRKSWFGGHFCGEFQLRGTPSNSKLLYKIIDDIKEIKERLNK